jgi:hypothetical protein
MYAIISHILYIYVYIHAYIYSMQRNAGALTLPELRARFKVVRTEMRKAALAPPELPSVVGLFLGLALFNLSTAPEGYIPGKGVEEILSRATYMLDRGKLEDALAEVHSVQGYEKNLAKDWIALAEDRIIADNALKVAKAKLLLAQSSMPKDS